MNRTSAEYPRFFKSRFFAFLNTCASAVEKEAEKLPQAERGAKLSTVRAHGCRENPQAGGKQVAHLLSLTWLFHKSTVPINPVILNIFREKELFGEFSGVVLKTARRATLRTPLEANESGEHRDQS